MQIVVFIPELRSLSAHTEHVVTSPSLSICVLSLLISYVMYLLLSKGSAKGFQSPKHAARKRFPQSYICSQQSLAPPKALPNPGRCCPFSMKPTLTLGLSLFWYPKRVKGLHKEWGSGKIHSLISPSKVFKPLWAAGPHRKGRTSSSTCWIFSLCDHRKKKRQKMLLSYKCSAWIITVQVYS